MMAVLCCCCNLLPKKRALQPTSQDNNQPNLPARPPAARLPPSEPRPPPPSPQSTVARSSLTNPLPGTVTDLSIQLGELIVDDSDDDHGYDGVADDNRNKSASTLQLVKAAIRRHLSQDSLTRQSETEEQIARRAEVKRLMRQRIQEELRSETDEARSGSSTPHRLRSSTLHLPGNGPRDTIEFTVDNAKREKALTECELRCSADSTGLSPCRRLSRLSNPSSARSLQSATRPDSLQNHLRRRNSVPEVSASPLLGSVRVSSYHETSSLASWRLSLSADKLSAILAWDRDLSPFRPPSKFFDVRAASDVKDWESGKRMRSKSSPLVVRDPEAANVAHSRQPSLHSNYRTQVPASQSLIRGESPVGLWLRTQSQNFRLSTPSQSARDSGDESFRRPSSNLTVIPCSNIVEDEKNAEVTQSSPAKSDSGSQKTPQRSNAAIRRKRTLSERDSPVLSEYFENRKTPRLSGEMSRHELPIPEPELPVNGASVGSSLACEGPDLLSRLPTDVACIPSVKENRRGGFNILWLSYFQRE